MKLNLYIILIILAPIALSKNNTNIQIPSKSPLVDEKNHSNELNKTTYTCSSDRKVKINGWKTPFTKVGACAGGTYIEYSCTDKGMSVTSWPFSTHCDSQNDN